MMKNGSDEHIDRLLDEMLALYSVVEPRSGLEGRLLANVRSKPSGGRLFWLIPVATLTTALILAWTLGLGWRPEQKMKTAAKTEVRAPSTTGKRREPLAITASRLRARRSQSVVPRFQRRRQFGDTAAIREARLEQFPTPLPETEQERLLRAYVLHASKTDLEAAELLQGPLAELKIRNLSITKLRIPELDNNSQYRDSPEE